MKCKRPFRRGLGEYGCGQCLPCRINRQRLLTIRGVLEAGQHPYSLFSTFTYSDEFLPSSGSVSVREVQLLLKRLRKRVGPFRYMVCGEYGERTWRPHYHAILYGVRDGRSVEEAWGQGRVHHSGVGPESVAYVAGYCLKGAYNERGMKWHGKDLAPEFVRMSLRPGLGAHTADQIAAFYLTQVGSGVLASAGDVSNVVRQGQRHWSLGRYLVGRIRNSVGISKDAVSGIRQLREGAELKSLDQEALNLLLEQRMGVSERSGLLAEARARRQSLERKI